MRHRLPFEWILAEAMRSLYPPTADRYNPTMVKPSLLPPILARAIRNVRPTASMVTSTKLLMYMPKAPAAAVTRTLESIKPTLVDSLTDY